MAALFVVVSVNPAWAIGDGPKAYQPLPDGSDMFVAYQVLLYGGNQTASSGHVIQGSDLDLSLTVLQYTHTFKFMDQQGALFCVLPFGEIDGSLRLPGSTISASSSGLGDMQLGCVVGLHGSPSLPRSEYTSYDPGFAYGLLGRVYMPTGEYDEDKALNLGANRWGFQFGVPVSYDFGESFVDPSGTKLELIPSVTFYTDNDEPFNADKTEQDPLFNIEGHLIHNFNKAIWASLDSLYTFGGETTTDGVDGDDRQQALFLGGTINVSVSNSTSFKFSYGETVDRNDDGPDGSMCRFNLSIMF